MPQSETTLRIVLSRIVADHGYLSVNSLAELAQLDRLRLVLVRCGNGRFLCPAQDAPHFMAIIRRDFDAHNPDCDYVRDVSLPADDPAYRGQHHAHTVEGSYRRERTPPAAAARSGFPAHCYTREPDYSGTFDGFSVQSDADPGL